MYKLYTVNGYGLNSLTKYLPPENKWHTILKGPNSKYWLMRINFTCFLLFFAFLQFSFAANGQNVSLTKKNASLSNVFKEIKKQTGYDFIYKSDLLKTGKRVDIQSKNEPLIQVLNKCFENQPFTYSLKDNTIIVKLKDEAPVPKIEDIKVQVTISGRVTDTTGAPLPGVTVRVKRGKETAITDADGKFKLSVPDNSTLIFSYIGYASKEIAIGNASFLNVRLTHNNQSINEVVVTGFGEKREKRSLGYSVTQISGDEIRSANPINPIDALQGKVAGLQVTPGIGGPQASTRFLIRGSASLDPYGNTPLVVVDDIVMDQDVVLPNRGGTQDFGNILKDINPDDIESISVLKGGAVTALYGSKANNGVILITTKKGYSQKGLGITFSHSDMFDKAYKTVDLQNSFGSGFSTDDWVKGANGELQVNPNTYGYNYGPPMTGQTFRDISGLLVKNTPDKNNVLSLYQTGVTDNTNVSIAGGNEKATFRFSYSNLESKAITPNNHFGRNSFNLRATQRLIKGVLLDANVTYTRSNTLNPVQLGSNSILYNYVWNAPRNYDTKYWSTNYIDPVNGGLNTKDISTADLAFWRMYQNKYTQVEDNLRADLNLKAELTQWLRLEGSSSVNYYGSTFEQSERGGGAGFMSGNGLSADYQTNTGNTIVSRYKGDFVVHKNVKNLDMSLLMGGEADFSQSKRIYAYTNGGFIIPDVYRLSNSLSPSTSSEDPPNKTVLSSLFFQGNFDYKSYVYLNIYGRNDWNSTLVYNDGHGNYSYFYPGADLAFVFTDAFKLPQYFSYGKIRFSYVQTGGGTNAYTANTGAYSPGTPYNFNSGSPVINYGYASNTLPNQTLLPVRSAKFETGLEFRMFRNRLGADISVYQQDSKNQIISFGVPVESGVSTALINAGKIRNKGIEVLLYGTPVKTRNFSWDVSLNATHNSNKILSLPFGLKTISLDGQDGIESVAQLGGDYGTIRSSYGQASYVASDPKSPLNGMPVVSISNSGLTGEPMIIYRRASNYNGTYGGETEPIVGSLQPKLLAGLRNQFNYKRFSLMFFLDGKFGGDVFSSTLNYGMQTGAIAGSLAGRTTASGGLTYKDSKGNTRQDGILPTGVFRPNSIVSASNSADGQQHDLSGMTVADAYKKGYIKPDGAIDYYSYTYGWGNGIRSFSLVKSSWISLRQMSVTYDLPSSWASKLKLNGLRASLIVNNLFFLYNSAPDGLNPDNLSSTSSGAFTENGGVPYVRSYGFSINGSL